MQYSQALEFIYSRRRFEKSAGFERITRLLSLLGRPEQGLCFVHVVGTNGKGSVSSFLSSILCAAGYKTGLFTSPFVKDFCERIQLNGANVEKSELCLAADKVKSACDKMDADGAGPTFFEVVFAMALLCFKWQGCDIAVIEAGIGGRTDTTNALHSAMLCVLCSVSLDHTEVLGGTIEKIAAEKCAVVKPGSCLVSFPDKQYGLDFVPQSGQAVRAAKKRCADVGAELYIADVSTVRIIYQDFQKTVFTLENGQYTINLGGEHQIANAVTAICAARRLCALGLSITEGDIRRGLESARLSARMHVVGHSPLVIVDGGHNEGCFKALARFAGSHLGGRKTVLLCAFMSDKRWRESLAHVLPLCDEAVFTRVDEGRGESAQSLCEFARDRGVPCVSADSPFEALELALAAAGRQGAVICAGSFYLAGEIEKIFDLD